MNLEKKGFFPSRGTSVANSGQFIPSMPATALLLLALTLLPLSRSLAQPIQCAIVSTVTNKVLVSWNATPGKHYDIQAATVVSGGWTNPFSPPETFTAVSNKLGAALPVDAAARFFRIAEVSTNNVPPGMALVPAGSFTMGNCMNTNEGAIAELPTHTVYVNEFYMDRYEVTKALWDTVHTWAATNGYDFDNVGAGKAADHPVQSINWYDMLKWCNARSEKESRVPAYYTDAGLTTIYKTGKTEIHVKRNSGYRLPTEAEWEKAARGGASGHRFPWASDDTIDHSRANFFSYWENGTPFYLYDLSTTNGYHPSYEVGAEPYTAPVGSFAPNGYGLYDMAGNMWEWCWDWYRANYYSSSPGNNPTGPTTGANRVGRGGGNDDYAGYCRVASRYFAWEPATKNVLWGFRAVLPVGSP